MKSALRQKPAVIHLGAYGTGTNWTQKTLTDSGVNIYTKAGQDPESGKLIRHFFKHYIIEPDTLSILRPPDNILFICLVKSPLYWFKSLQRMVKANIMPAREMRKLGGSGLSSFIRAPGTMVGARREIEQGAVVGYDNLPDFWNRYVSGYLQNLPSDQTHVLPYELAVRDPETAFGAILDKLDASRSQMNIHSGRRFGNQGKSDGVGHDLAESQTYYSVEENRVEGYSENDIAFVNETVDGNLLCKIGYRQDGSI